LGALLPQVIFTGVCTGRCASRLISVSCGNAHVSGAHTTASTFASTNCRPTMSACFSPSISSGLHTTFTAVPSGILTCSAMTSAIVSTIPAARSREGWSIRGSPVAHTPNVTTRAVFFRVDGSFFACPMFLSPVK